MKLLLPLIATLLLVGPALGQHHGAGVPPLFKVVHKVDATKGYVQFREAINVKIPVFVERKVVKDGREVVEKVVEYRTEIREEISQIDVAQGRVITPDGKQLPIDEVWKRMKANSVVVVSGDGNTPASWYLRALNADTLIVIPPMPTPVPKKS